GRASSLILLFLLNYSPINGTTKEEMVVYSSFLLPPSCFLVIECSCYDFCGQGMDASPFEWFFPLLPSGYFLLDTRHSDGMTSFSSSSSLLLFLICSPIDGKETTR
ncbi:hypothetical protein PMAYCL1PPCAC_22535, partial [Pristionchus mayeri]